VREHVVVLEPPLLARFLNHMASRSSLLLSLALGTVASPPWGGAQDKSASCWDLAKFTSLVTFGDSYTDDSRLGYFIANGTAPPVGYDNPAVSDPIPRSWGRR
jgi:hypothetical protein